MLAYYYATITQLDHHVGRMLDTLTAYGLDENTMVIFTADHGEYLGFHHQLLKAGRWLYDPLVRVPLLIRYPGGYRAGEIDDTLVSQLDLAPTICSAAGVPWTPTPGHDLGSHGADRDVVITETVGATAYMARSATHKLLRTVDGRHDALFDLDTDPYELTNVLGDPEHATVCAGLDAALTREIMFHAPPPTYLDDAAPCIDAPNVPARDDARVADARAYFATRTRAYSSHTESPETRTT